VYDKERFDKSKAKVHRHNVGDFVLLKNEERHQTKLSPKFKRPFEITQVLEGDRRILKSLTSKRTYKYAHEDLRILPDGEVPEELNVCDDYNNVETENENISNVEVAEESEVAKKCSTAVQKETAEYRNKI